jgi:large subunit ribosomal protein L17
MAEKIITLGKRGDLHARRQALRFVYDGKVVKKVFDDISPRMRERPGGYLRIVALDARKGDGARMATIEIVDAEEAAPAVAARTQRPAGASPSARRTAAPSTPAAPVAPAAQPSAPAAEPELDGDTVEPPAAADATDLETAGLEETPSALAGDTAEGDADDDGEAPEAGAGDGEPEGDRED